MFCIYPQLSFWWCIAVDKQTLIKEAVELIASYSVQDKHQLSDKIKLTVNLTSALALKGPNLHLGARSTRENLFN